MGYTHRFTALSSAVAVATLSAFVPSWHAVCWQPKVCTGVLLDLHWQRVNKCSFRMLPVLVCHANSTHCPTMLLVFHSYGVATLAIAIFCAPTYVASFLKER